MNCRPGDLAIVVRANIPSNVGLLVRVIGADLGDWIPGEAMRKYGHLWLCESLGRPIVYQSELSWVGTISVNTGPIPDAMLRPLPPEREISTSTQRREIEHTE